MDIFNSNKWNQKPLWQMEEEKKLKDVLGRLYSSTTLESLEEVFIESARSHPKYHNLLKAAKEERLQQISQKDPKLSFEAIEKKIRKIWLWSFFANFIVDWLIIVFAFVAMELPKGNYLATFLGISILSFFTFGKMFAIYLFAYVKKGIVMLNLIVFVFPLLAINSLVKDGIDVSLWYLYVLQIGLFGFFWISSIRLREINQEVKTRSQLAVLKSSGLTESA